MRRFSVSPGAPQVENKTKKANEVTSPWRVWRASFWSRFSRSQGAFSRVRAFDLAARGAGPLSAPRRRISYPLAAPSAASHVALSILFLSGASRPRVEPLVNVMFCSRSTCSALRLALRRFCSAPPLPLLLSSSRATLTWAPLGAAQPTFVSSPCSASFALAVFAARGSVRSQTAS